ncbi:diphthine--ammonia ligase [Christiangramia aquimixticola]|uniref:Dph6-related ATP pyrophosphatase n=1 Tax=Christiangramia aquimixticola TaxID=1697558 RepID=UPI003AA9A8C8
MNKTYLNWSSGKDSALALYYSLQNDNLKVEKLFTTLNKEVDRVTMHGVRRELLLKQAEALDLPIMISELDTQVSMEAYNCTMQNATARLKDEGYTHSLFGDIFLEDLRKYREQQLAETGIIAEFPLWKKNTHGLMQEFIQLGFKAIVVCTSSKYLDDSFCGRIIDEKFLSDLPENVDPCGENGEFHTFVFDGPIFKEPVQYEVGEKVRRSYKPAGNKEDNCFKTDDCFKEETASWDIEFCFCDLLPM